MFVVVESVALGVRSDDIPMPAAHFVGLSCRRLNRAEPALTRCNISQLQALPRTGNIRELQNVIERAIILSQGGRLQFKLPTAALSARR